MSLVSSSHSRSRDLRLDSLRGLMLVGMAMNHIASPFHLFTDHPLGYTSSAEGFVFLSGLVAGLVYTRRLVRKGEQVLAAASWHRACVLYLVHIALFVGLLLWTNAWLILTGTFAGNTPPEMWQYPVRALVAGLLLVNQPPLLDILPLYAGLMLVLPFVLRALSAGRHGLVWLVSGLCWAGTNLVFPQVPYIHGSVQIGAFTFGAWQFLFVAGATFGHAWATGCELFPRRRWPLAAFALLVCFGCFMVRHWYWPAPFPEFADWVNKNNLAPARLVNTLALFYLVYLAAARWPRAFAWPALAYLGRNSLVVFATHVAAAYVIFAFPECFSSTLLRTWLGAAVMLTAMYGAAWFRERQRRGTARTPSGFPGLSSRGARSAPW